jgi:hypothetical protein
VYAYEGVGVILPVYEITENKENYFRVICTVLGAVTVMYIGFSEFCLFTYYE